MKHWIITAIVGTVAFAGGCLAGWEARKRTEVAFEEVTEEELNAYVQKDQEKPAKEEDQKPVISDSKSAHAQINTAKTEYASHWVDSESAAEKYITRSELPEGEDPVISDEDLANLDLDEKLVIDDLDDKLPPIEESDEDEFERWLAEPDGEYQSIEVTWMSGDNVVVDEDGDPIGNHQRYLGFDPKKEFTKMGIPKDAKAELYRKNNLLQVIYKVTQYPASYSTRAHQEVYGADDDG